MSAKKQEFLIDYTFIGLNVKETKELQDKHAQFTSNAMVINNYNNSNMC